MHHKTITRLTLAPLILIITIAMIQTYILSAHEESSTHDIVIATNITLTRSNPTYSVSLSEDLIKLLANSSNIVLHVIIGSIKGYVKGLCVGVGLSPNSASYCIYNTTVGKEIFLQVPAYTFRAAIISNLKVYITLSGIFSLTGKGEITIKKVYLSYQGHKIQTKITPKTTPKTGVTITRTAITYTNTSSGLENAITLLEKALRENNVTLMHKYIKAAIKLLRSIALQNKSRILQKSEATLISNNITEAAIKLANKLMETAIKEYNNGNYSLAYQYAMKALLLYKQALEVRIIELKLLAYNSTVR